MNRINTAQFSELMKRVRSGDQLAAAELLRLYEPAIRRDIRLRLSNPKLRRVVDSVDIAQSVFGNFFVRAVYGEFELERPEQLFGLLSRMVTNKVIDKHRRATTRRIQDLVDSPVEDCELADHNAATASEVVARAELLEQFEQRLTKEENQIARMRRDGKSWNDIADQLEGRPDALRKKLMRACDRVLTELGENTELGEK